MESLSKIRRARRQSKNNSRVDEELDEPTKFSIIEYLNNYSDAQAKLLKSSKNIKSKVLHFKKKASNGFTLKREARKSFFGKRGNFKTMIIPNSDGGHLEQKLMFSEAGDVKIAGQRSWEEDIEYIFRVVKELKDIGYPEKKINGWLTKYWNQRKKEIMDIFM